MQTWPLICLHIETVKQLFCIALQKVAHLCSVLLPLGGNVVRYYFFTEQRTDAAGLLSVADVNLITHCIPDMNQCPIQLTKKKNKSS